MYIRLLFLTLTLPIVAWADHLTVRPDDIPKYQPGVYTLYKEVATLVYDPTGALTGFTYNASVRDFVRGGLTVEQCYAEHLRLSAIPTVPPTRYLCEEESPPAKAN